MNIIVFGAAGATGRCLVDKALQQGHHVTAAVRSLKGPVVAHPRLRVIQCDVRDADAVRNAVRNHEVVLCALGGPRRGVSVYSEGARNIVSGMRAMNVRRLVFLSNYGVLGETARGPLTRMLLLLAKFALSDTLTDHRRALALIRESGVEWVAVRPMALTKATGTGQYRINVNALPDNGTHIARADVADFMLGAAVSDRYLREAPGIAY